ncbi:MAG: MerR family DNA-binding protein [Aquincola sp.]|nr:MerR family DNA-binding protein [Aquincola sp.]
MHRAHHSALRGNRPAASGSPKRRGQRSYGEPARRRLTLIRRCRDFGFSIEQVRKLVGLVDQPDRPRVEVREIAAAHLVQVRRKLEELRVPGEQPDGVPVHLRHGMCWWSCGGLQRSPLRRVACAGVRLRLRHHPDDDDQSQIATIEIIFLIGIALSDA